MVYAEDSARIRECLGVRAQQIFSSFLKLGAHVEEDELAAEMLGELRRPGNCALGGFGPVGGNDDLHLSKVHPPPRKFNGAQQIAYTSIILMGFGSVLTGLAIYKPVQFSWLVALFGGYPMARWFHFWLTVGYVAFFLIHVGQVIKTGWNNFRAMVIGVEVREVPNE